MEIIPVIDIMDGTAVSGKSGVRKEYSPLKTIFCKSSDPVVVASSIPSKSIYIADLDGIMKRIPDYKTLEKLGKIKEILVDVGVRDYVDLRGASKLRCDIILGTETLEGIDVLIKGVEKFQDRIIVSIDIKSKKVLSKFLPQAPINAYKVLRAHCKRFIFLDITSVGTLRGSRFDYLEDVTKDAEIMVGGGIRKEDLPKLEEMGVDAVLIGTALHKGFITIK
ncbi:MAG: HisA/HisF-related TIM barrel protein [Candidatus Hydrothermarchaeales archaeon]